jgi:hypothetical protein
VKKGHEKHKAPSELGELYAPLTWAQRLKRVFNLDFPIPKVNSSPSSRRSPHSKLPELAVTTKSIDIEQQCNKPHPKAYSMTWTQRLKNVYS